MSLNNEHHSTFTFRLKSVVEKAGIIMSRYGARKTIRFLFPHYISINFFREHHRYVKRIAF